MLPGPEDHKQWSHPLHCPNPVFFLLKLAPGWDHSHLEWFQSRNGQCAFWYSPFLWAGETQGCFLVLCWRTKGFAVQNKGGGTSAVRMCSGIQSPSTRKMCENNPDRCCLNSQRINRHKIVIGSLLCKIRGWTRSRSLEEAHSFTAAPSQCEAAVPLEGCNPAACFWPVLSFPLDIFKSYFYTLTPVKEWVQVKCCPLLPGCSWPGSDPQASREQQHRHQQWDKEGGGQSARDSGTSAFNSSTGLCCFKMTVKLWKNFQCLQWRIIITKKITQSSNLFFFKNFF